MRPRIIITSYHVDTKELAEKRLRGVKGQSLDVCVEDYAQAVFQTGGLPLIIPSIGDQELIDDILSLADGILFSGGEDVHPRHYGEEIITDNLKIVEKRDEFELMLAKAALARELPLFGICRGMQLLNIAAGGTLYQDISQQRQTGISHSNPQNEKWELVHRVDLSEGTKLQKIYGAKTNQVNSFHHQGVKKLASGFILSAVSEDGIIEGYEIPGERFVMAVQWHPEMMFEKHRKEKLIFQHFIRSAIKYKNKTL